MRWLTIWDSDWRFKVSLHGPGPGHCKSWPLAAPAPQANYFSSSYLHVLSLEDAWDRFSRLRADQLCKTDSPGWSTCSCQAGIWPTFRGIKEADVNKMKAELPVFTLLLVTFGHLQDQPLGPCYNSSVLQSQLTSLMVGLVLLFKDHTDFQSLLNYLFWPWLCAWSSAVGKWCLELEIGWQENYFPFHSHPTSLFL